MHGSTITLFMLVKYHLCIHECLSSSLKNYFPLSFIPIKMKGIQVKIWGKLQKSSHLSRFPQGRQKHFLISSNAA